MKLLLSGRTPIRGLETSTLAARKPLLSHTVASKIHHGRQFTVKSTGLSPNYVMAQRSLAGASRAIHDGLRSIPDWRRLTGASRTSYFSLLLQYIPDGESDHQRQRLWHSTSEVSGSNTPLLLQRWLTIGLPQRRAVTAL